MKKIRNIKCLIALCLLSCFVFAFNTITAFAYTTATVEIPVTCLKISDGNTHIYTVKIESENNSSPAPLSDTLEIRENGTGRFKIDISEPGTYEYRIYEKPGTESNIKYDKNTYIVTVFVEHADENKLKYAVSAKIAGSNDKPEQIIFGNETMGSSDSGTTTTKTDSTSSSGEVNENPLTGYIENLLTGDSFRARAVRITMLSLILIAISTFLFKRDKNEEEEKNEK